MADVNRRFQEEFGFPYVGHDIEVVFVKPAEREDGALVQLEMVKCSCGWESEPLRKFEVLIAARSHAEAVWRETQ